MFSFMIYSDVFTGEIFSSWNIFSVVRDLKDTLRTCVTLKSVVYSFFHDFYFCFVFCCKFFIWGYNEFLYSFIVFLAEFANVCANSSLWQKWETGKRKWSNKIWFLDFCSNVANHGLRTLGMGGPVKHLQSAKRK